MPADRGVAEVPMLVLFMSAARSLTSWLISARRFFFFFFFLRRPARLSAAGTPARARLRFFTALCRLRPSPAPFYPVPGLFLCECQGRGGTGGGRAQQHGRTLRRRKVLRPRLDRRYLLFLRLTRPSRCARFAAACVGCGLRFQPPQQ